MALLALPALLWFCRRGAGEEVALPVVMYHRVCGQEEDADRYTVSAAGLEKDLEALPAAGYTPVRLSQVLDYARSGGPLPRRPVLLVFDDGDASFAHWAMPVLKKYDVPAVVSVIGDAAAGAQGEAGESLTWNQLAALEKTGLVELQSHSASLYTYARPGGEAPARRERTGPRRPAGGGRGKDADHGGRGGGGAAARLRLPLRRAGCERGKSAASGGHAGHHDQRGALQHAHPLAGVPLPFGAL